MLGALALLVDRCVLSESVTAPPDAAAVERPTVRPVRPDPPNPAAVSIPELPFPRNLPRFDARADIRDLFSASSADLAGSTADKGRRRSPRDADPTWSDSATFVSRHHLQGAMLQDRLKIAIVDGVWVRIGESIDGCELTDVAGNKVRFACYDGPAELILPARSGSSRD